MPVPSPPRPARSSRALATFALLAATSLVACGAPPPAPPRPVSPSPAPPPPAAVASEPLPTACVEGPVCSMPSAFARRLCASPQQEAALHLFGPKTPWKRAYVKRSFQAWHVGGHGELRELMRGEEVLVVSGGGGGGGGGMQIGGRAFEVLRFDGTCVSLMEDELDFHKPPSPAAAKIAWKRLDPAYQAAFASDQRVGALRANEERLCSGTAADKEPGKTKCELARRQLSLAIAQTVGRGAALPPHDGL